MSNLLPMYILILWTVIIGALTAMKRNQAVAKKEVRVKDIALNSQNFPENILKYGNNFNNLFQVPLLFYVLCLAAQVQHFHNGYFTALSWIFVASRIIHSIVHITNNNILYRFSIFIMGVVTVMFMTLLLMVKA